MKAAKINTGILAHVDAGKTTLAESILYLTGSIRRAGRVDHQDAFLDTYELERARGITIFSKQAEVKLGEVSVTLLDTPGHVDFSAEMERTLQVLDYAILVISGADGVQGHVLTLWRLLKKYQIPVFLFVNKMDQEGTDPKRLLLELQERLDEHCISFEPKQPEEVFLENLAVCEEAALEQYLESGSISAETIRSMIQKREVFPCYFGSALKMTGVEAFLKGLERYMAFPEYGEVFGARVFKIARDAQGKRLTYLKVTGGTLQTKQLLQGQERKKTEAEGRTADGMETAADWQEKADQIRIYSGAGFTPVSEAGPGTVCAVTGLTKTYCGEQLGCSVGMPDWLPLLEPVLTYEIMLPKGADVHGTFLKLKQLEEEIPELNLVWKERLQEIHAQVMGEVQIEILKSLILERLGMEVSFGAGSIVYKETIAAPVEGVGHFEPLRHYAEVHLWMEPGEPGSGMQFDTVCSTDQLDLNWQRLILTHLEERQHLGILTGSELTDMRITLAAGRAHLKHTEGGDFRQATYRAVRQGLKMAECILLEPVYEYRLEVPQEMVGRAMTDIQKRYGTFASPVLEGAMAVLTGTAPAATMRKYQTEVTAYTRGCGHLVCTLKGYEPCHNTEEVILAAGYDPEADLENPTGSVFCAHGAGYVVPWDQVPDHMHLDSVRKQFEVERAADGADHVQKQNGHTGRPGIGTEPGSGSGQAGRQEAGGGSGTYRGYGPDIQDDKELYEIFHRTYGSISQDRGSWNRRSRSYGETGTVHRAVPKEKKEEYLLVDGYNIIFAWEELKELSNVSLDAARSKLMDILCNYQGYRKMNLILVFDAYKVEAGQGEVSQYHNIHVVYTKEAETADQYIEKTVHRIGTSQDVTVATSDAAEQVIIWGQGARRMSARELKKEIQNTCIEIQNQYLTRHPGGKNYLFENLSADLAAFMEEVRLGRQSFGDKTE